MVITVGGNRVSITVCESFSGNTKIATMNFLNELSAFCEEAARRYYSRDLNHLGDHARRYGTDIYKELQKRGCYDDLYEEKEEQK